MKILFTTVTLEAGFKGGEIVPTLTIGAAFGSFFAFLFGQPVGLMTACGMLGLFVGVTNCPISTLLLGFELFGYEAMPFFVLVIAVSFSFSGYYSLYASQKFVYSKTSTEFINRKTNKYVENAHHNFDFLLLNTTKRVPIYLWNPKMSCFKEIHESTCSIMIYS